MSDDKESDFCSVHEEVGGAIVYRRCDVTIRITKQWDGGKCEDIFAAEVWTTVGWKDFSTFSIEQWSEAGPRTEGQQRRETAEKVFEFLNMKLFK